MYKYVTPLTKYRRKLLFDLKEHLKLLVESHAPSGYEGSIATLIESEWKPFVDEFDHDKIGSLIGIKRANKPLETESPFKIMLAAHMDEIGLMVRDIVDGFLYVHRISGVDNRVMLAQPVLVHGKEQLPGIVATVPPHLLKSDQRGKYPSFDDLVVDVGLPAEIVEDLVQIGDVITVDVPMVELQNGRIVAKTLDDRASVAAISVCLHELQSINHAWDVYAVATVQEESGLLGAATSAHHINPDVAIALDVTFADQPGVNSHESFELGSGVAIGFGANFHPKLVTALQDVANNYEMKITTDIMPARSGTDAWAIQITREGIPTALLGMPIRNMHSPVETTDLEDIRRTGRLLAEFIRHLDEEFISKLTWDDVDEEEDE